MKQKVLFIVALTLFTVLSAAACTNPPTVTQSMSETTPPQEQSSTETSSAQEQPSTPEPSTESGLQGELIVFAAASMTETLEEIALLYAAKEPDVKLTFNFDSSGTLKTQIQEGAPCDLFISAGQRQMDQLDITASASVNTENLDFVLDYTRLDLLENQVTLVVPSGNPANINSFDDMKEGLVNGQILLAMGNSDVPVGQYTQQILEYYELNEETLAAAGSISYGSNVKEVTTQVAEASVDCGIIYCTDAFSAGLDIVDYATTDMCGQVIYPAAVMKTSDKIDIASDFLHFLISSEATEVFEKVGFSPLNFVQI